MAMFQINPFLSGNPYFANNPFLRLFSFGDAPRPVAPQTPAGPPVGLIGGGQGVGLLGGEGGGPGSGPGPSGSSSGGSHGGVAPAGTSGDIGIGGKIGSAAQGMLGAAVPGGMLANAAITGLNVANHNSQLNDINAPNIGLMGTISAIGNAISGGMLGTSAAQQAAQNALGTNEAMGIGVTTGSVDMSDHTDSSGSAPAGDGPNGGQGGNGDTSTGGYAKGGVIAAKNIKGNAPDKVDDGWAQVKAGEGVLNRGAMGLLGAPLLNALNALGAKRMAGRPGGRGLLG